MSLIAKDNPGGGFTPVPPGSHVARCYRIIDLGTQRTEYKGDVKLQHKIMVQFEVHSEDDHGVPLTTDKGEPMSISKNYTLSLSDKATLRHDLESWRGRQFTEEELRGFELKNVLGAWAMITVVRSQGADGKSYTNIANVNPIPKTMKASLPDGFNEAKMFTLNDPDMLMFETFGQKLKEKIKSAPEWTQDKPAKTGAHPFEDMEDDIPF